MNENEIERNDSLARDTVICDSLEAYRLGIASKNQKMNVSLSLSYQIIKAYPEIKDPEIRSVVIDLLNASQDLSDNFIEVMIA